MEVWELNPFVRYMDQRIGSVSYEKAILAYDYRLFAVQDGACRVETDDGVIPLNKHSIILIPPGTPYRMLYDSQHPARLYDVNFLLGYIPGPSLSQDTRETFDPSRMPEKPDGTLLAHVQVAENAGGLFPSLGELLAWHERGGEYAPELCAAVLKTILVRILQQTGNNAAQGSSLTAQLCRYLDEHCREALSSDEIGQVFGYHPVYLNRLLRRETGWTIHRYQVECRMKRACSMLEHTRLSVREIADSLGFSRDAYFSELFHQMRGMPPTEYRRQKQL